MCDKSVEEC